MGRMSEEHMSERRGDRRETVVATSGESSVSEFWADVAAGTDDPARVVEAVTRYVAEVVGEGSVLTVVADGGELLTPLAVYHPDPDIREFMQSMLGRSTYHVSEGVVGSVVTTGAPIVLGGLPDAATTTVVSAATREFTRVHPIKALMIVPLVARGSVIGTLGVIRTVSDEEYTADDLGTLEALAARAADVLDAVRSEPQLLGRADYEAVFRYAVDGVLFTAPDGRVLAANPAACRILERSEAELCALGRAGIVVGDDPRSERAVAQRRVAGQVRAEIPMRRGSGEVFVADVSSTVFPTPEGDLRALVVFRDVTDEVAAREEQTRRAEEMERAAVTDELTGLWNRRGFFIAAQHAFALADRQGVPVQMLFLDVDGLKHVNDRFGHLVGDAVLVAVGRAITHEVRSSDASARFGGDEFVVLLYDASPEQATAVAGRLVMRVTGDGTIPDVGLSVGVSERRPGADLTVADLLRSADTRMYEEKLRHTERVPRLGLLRTATDDPPE